MPFEIVNFKKLQILDEEPFKVFSYVTEPQIINDPENGDSKPSLKTVANEAEYEMIMQVLRDVNFNKSKAARLLNIDRKTLYNKMKQFDIPLQ